MTRQQKKQGKEKTVKGYHLPSPRYTWRFFAGIGLYILLPLFLLLFLLDVGFYLFFDRYLDSCYGILCLFDK